MGCRREIVVEPRPGWLAELETLQTPGVLDDHMVG